MGVEKSQGQLIIERIKNGPPVKLHKIEKLDYLFHPVTKRIEREIIKSIVTSNLRNVPLTYSELGRKVGLDWHVLDKKIKELSNFVDENNCYCFSVTVSEIRMVYGNSFKRLIGNPNLLYGLFTKNRKPVYQSTFPGENYITIPLKPHKL